LNNLGGLLSNSGVEYNSEGNVLSKLQELAMSRENNLGLNKQRKKKKPGDPADVKTSVAKQAGKTVEELNNA